MLRMDKDEGLCRVCLSTADSEMVSMYEEVHGRTLEEKLRFLEFMQVHEDDGLSSLVCSQCYERVDDSFELKLLCQKSSATLQRKSDVMLQPALESNANCKDTSDAALKNASSWNSHGKDASEDSVTVPVGLPNKLTVLDMLTSARRDMIRSVKVLSSCLHHNFVILREANSFLGNVVFALEYATNYNDSFETLTTTSLMVCDEAAAWASKCAMVEDAVTMVKMLTVTDNDWEQYSEDKDILLVHDDSSPDFLHDVYTVLEKSTDEVSEVVASNLNMPSSCAKDSKRDSNEKRCCDQMEYSHNDAQCCPEESTTLIDPKLNCSASKAPLKELVTNSGCKIEIGKGCSNMVSKKKRRHSVPLTISKSKKLSREPAISAVIHTVDSDAKICRPKSKQVTESNHAANATDLFSDKENSLKLTSKKHLVYVTPQHPNVSKSAGQGKQTDDCKGSDSKLPEKKAVVLSLEGTCYEFLPLSKRESVDSNVSNKMETDERSSVKDKKMVQTTEGQDSLECPICNLKIEQKNLRGHMNLHTKQLKYQCDICYKVFNSKTNLVAHSRTHTGEQPYQCRFCERRFSQGWNRTQHERRHTGDKPYVCSLCNQAYRHNVSLRQHMNAKH